MPMIALCPDVCQAVRYRVGNGYRLPGEYGAGYIMHLQRIGNGVPNLEVVRSLVPFGNGKIRRSGEACIQGEVVLPRSVFIDGDLGEIAAAHGPIESREDGFGTRAGAGGALVNRRQLVLLERALS